MRTFEPKMLAARPRTKIYESADIEEEITFGS